MSNEILFGAVAPAYFQRGIPVIPLQPFNNNMVKSPGKQPIPVGWSAFASTPVPFDTQDYWITHNADANIGLVTGPESGVIFIDVDSVDPKVSEAVAQALGVQSPWIRIGQKGYVAAYRYAPYMKNFRIKDMEGHTLVECLAFGCQAVIPPSVHPKTKQPYRENCPLLSVIDHLPLAPEDLESKMRSAIQLQGIELSHTGMSNLSDFAARGARDNQMTYVAGLFAHYVTKGERTLNEAFGQMEKWFETSVQKVDGDDVDLDKGTKKIVEFLQRDVVTKKKPLPIGWDRDLDPKVQAQLATIFTTEHVEWTADELKKYAYQQFMAFADVEDPKRLEAVQYIIERLARSPSLNNLEQEAIIAYLSQTSRIPGMSIPNIRKRIRELRQGDISGFSHMEIAQAVTERMEEFGALRQRNGIFYQWKGAQWQPLEDADILKVIAEQFDGFDITKKQHDHTGVVKVMRVTVPHGLCPYPVRGVNFANGFLQFEEHDIGGSPVTKLTLKPHMPDFGATYTLPYRYMPELSGKCPNFLRLLHDSWGEDPDYVQKIMALQQMMAVSFFQYGPVVQRCCLLYGVANSGKSTIIKIIRGLFPDDSVSVVPPDQWEDRFQPTMMAGKLINVCNELPDKKLIEGKSFKEIIDGDELNGQFKMGQLFKFSPNCTHWFAANHLPRTLDTSDGFNRRWIILEFKRPINLDQKVLGLHNLIVAEEREAIAAWAIEAFLPLIAQKEPTLPLSHERLINDMANENNSVRFFLNESRRVLTRKKLVNKLAAATRNNSTSMENQQTSSLEMAGGGNPSNVIPLKSGVAGAITANRFKTVEEFDRYVISNHTSEDAIYTEYTMFCSKQAGVKGVGVRHFRGRLRELEHLHGFKTVVTETKDGYEICTYSGIVQVASSIN